MAYRVKLMPRAQRDLEDSVRSLRDIPYRCPVTPEDDGLRHLLFGHKPHVYRVIYRVVEEMKQVEVLHIRHGARDEFAPGDFSRP